MNEYNEDAYQENVVHPFLEKQEYQQWEKDLANED